MVDYKPMATPRITNWKKLSTSESDLVDPIVYRKWIGSLSCFAKTTHEQVMVVQWKSSCY